MTQLIMKDKTFRILLVDDNPDDVELVKDALESSELEFSVDSAYDGEEALDFLFKRAQFKDAATPQLIILDLNLPRIDGMEVLTQLKENPDTALIPIIMWSTGTFKEKISEAYSCRANFYVSKPNDYNQLMEFVEVVEFWFTSSTIPSTGI